MEETLIARLDSLGYSYNSETDSWLLTFCRESVESRIKNRINDSSIPNQLQEIEVDMICGEFLMAKKSTNQLNGYDFERIVQSIREGDTQVTFQSGSTPEQQFDSLIGNMIHGHDEDLIRFRKLVW